MTAIERFKAWLNTWHIRGNGEMPAEWANELSSEIDALLAERDRLREQLANVARLGGELNAPLLDSEEVELLTAAREVASAYSAATPQKDAKVAT